MPPSATAAAVVPAGSSVLTLSALARNSSSSALALSINAGALGVPTLQQRGGAGDCLFFFRLPGPMPRSSDAPPWVVLR